MRLLLLLPLFVTGALAVDFDFESGLASGWTTGVTGDHPWESQSGSTPTPATGPSSAHGGTYYYFTEASSRSTGAVFDLNYDGSSCAGAGIVDNSVEG